jgi:hypothetical protein
MRFGEGNMALVRPTLSNLLPEVLPMFGIHHYASFVAAILIFQLVPGAGTLAILRATARDGFRAGMGAVCGLAEKGHTWRRRERIAFGVPVYAHSRGR